MPRQLVITVRQDADQDHRTSAAEASGSVGSEQGRLTVPPASHDPCGASVILREGDDNVRVRALESRTGESERNTQTIRVLEGREVFARGPVSAGARAAGAASHGRRARGRAGRGDDAIPRGAERLLHSAARLGRPCVAGLLSCAGRNSNFRETQRNMTARPGGGTLDC